MSSNVGLCDGEFCGCYFCKSWEEFLGSCQGDEVTEISFFTLTMEEAAECLTDIRKQQKQEKQNKNFFAI